MNLTLQRSAVDEAARAVSRAGVFRFSKRNLYYELVRREALPAPGENPVASLRSFRASLEAMERSTGRLPGLVRVSDARLAVPAPTLVDVFDYAVRRTLIFDRLESMLVFAHNGFHRKVEVALLAVPDFPAHVWRRVTQQVSSGLRTAFYLVHDCTAAGLRLRRKVKKALHGQPRAMIAEAGITFGQAFELGIPVRRAPRALPFRGPSTLDAEERLLHASGDYAHFEELPPFDMMRWAFSRVGKIGQDAGFG